MKKTIFFCILLIIAGTFTTLATGTKVKFYTNMGQFEVELYDAFQPITTDNFKLLVNNKFYDGLLIHRVVAGFVIQGGDPNGNGTGGPGWTIQDEFDPNTSNVQKAVSMANAGPNTAGSQFFINLVDNVFLDPDYPVFGIVTNNFSVVQSIGAVAVDANDKPLSNVVMDSVLIMAWPTAISDIEEKSKLLLSVFPNPVTGNSVVSVESDKSQTVEMAIYDLFGKNVYIQHKQLRTGINTFSFADIKNLAAGNYTLVVANNKSFYKQKITIVK